MNDQSRIGTGPIRSIIIGSDPIASGYKISLNQIFKLKGNDEIKVVEIIRDENNYFRFGVVRYVVYASLNGSAPYAWKYYEGVPVTGS